MDDRSGTTILVANRLVRQSPEEFDVRAGQRLKSTSFRPITHDSKSYARACGREDRQVETLVWHEC